MQTEAHCLETFQMFCLGWNHTFVLNFTYCKRKHPTEVAMETETLGILAEIQLLAAKEKHLVQSVRGLVLTP